MSDIFGNNRSIKPTEQFASPEYFTLGSPLGSGLVQQVQAAYGRKVDSIYVVGDTSVYWGYQGAEGSLRVSRYVGKSFFEGVRGTTCGVISSINGSVEGSECTAGGARVTFQTLALLDVGFSVQAGATTIGETLNFKVGSLNV